MQAGAVYSSLNMKLLLCRLAVTARSISLLQKRKREIVWDLHTIGYQCAVSSSFITVSTMTCALYYIVLTLALSAISSIRQPSRKVIDWHLRLPAQISLAHHQGPTLHSIS